jgi:hypothetical protein
LARATQPVGGLWRAGELVGRRAVQPDAAAGLAAQLVQRVGVVQWQGTGAVEVAQRGRVQAAGDEIHPQRCALVAFHRFFDAQLAYRGVIVGHQAQALRCVLEQVQARARGIHRNGVAVARRQFQELRGHFLLPRAGAAGFHAALEFGAQLQQRGACLGVQHAGHVARLLQGAGAGGQQVTQGELGELEVGVVAHQALGLIQRIARLPLAREFQHLQQALFGLAVAQGRGGGRCRPGFFGACGLGLACGLGATGG